MARQFRTVLRDSGKYALEELLTKLEWSRYPVRCEAVEKWVRIETAEFTSESMACAHAHKLINFVTTHIPPLD